MNRETNFQGSDTLVVVDRSGRRKWLIIGVIVAIAAVILALAMFGGKDDAAPAGGPGQGKGGQIPTVTVVVPGNSQVARVITASGALAARRDHQVNVFGAQHGARADQCAVAKGTRGELHALRPVGRVQRKRSSGHQESSIP